MQKITPQYIEGMFKKYDIIPQVHVCASGSRGVAVAHNPTSHLVPPAILHLLASAPAVHAAWQSI